MLKHVMKWGISCSLLAIVLSGCATKKSVSNETITKSGSQQEAVTLTDQLGRTVTIEGEVERVVSSYHLVSSMLIALEAEEKVVGIEMKANTREIYKKAAPQFLELPAVGSGKTLNIEEIVSLDPDLVIIPYRLESFIPKLEELDIPVIAVKPETMESFLECALLVGKAIGHEAAAEQLVGFHEAVMSHVKTLTKDIEDRPVVYMSGSDSVFKAVSGNMYQNELIEMAGGINATNNLKDDYWVTLTPEALIEYDPSYIYPVSYADYTIDDVLNNVQVATVEAITNGAVKSFPSPLEPWDYPTPSSALGVLWLLQELHPDLYSKDSFEQQATEFYKTFYEIEVTAEELGL